MSSEMDVEYKFEDTDKDHPIGKSSTRPIVGTKSMFK